MIPTQVRIRAYIRLSKLHTAETEMPILKAEKKTARIPGSSASFEAGGPDSICGCTGPQGCGTPCRAVLIPAELEDKEEAEKLLPESAPDTHRTLKGEWFH